MVSASFRNTISVEICLIRVYFVEATESRGEFLKFNFTLASGCRVRVSCILHGARFFLPKRRLSSDGIKNNFASFDKIQEGSDDNVKGVGLISIRIVCDSIGDVLLRAGPHRDRSWMRVTVRAAYQPCLDVDGIDTYQPGTCRYGVHFRHAGRYQIFNKRRRSRLSGREWRLRSAAFAWRYSNQPARRRWRRLRAEFISLFDFSIIERPLHRMRLHEWHFKAWKSLVGWRCSFDD